MKLKSSISNSHASKLKRQDEALDIWRSNKGVGTLNHCPRFGKLYEGVKAINKLITKNVMAKVVVLVPSDIIAQQWRKLINNVVGLWSDVTVYTLYKLHSIDLSVEYDLVVIDEIHRFVTSDDNVKYILALKRVSKFQLGLLGVLPGKEDVDKIEMFAPIIDTISEKEAIENEWISNYEEYNLALELTNAQKIEYAKYTIPMKELMVNFKDLHLSFKVNGTPIFNSEIDLIISCYSGKRVLGTYAPSDRIRQTVASLNGWNMDMDMLDSNNIKIDNDWNPIKLYDKCKVFKTVMDKRNELLINNDVKLNKVVDIMKLNNVPTIIFNESIDFVDKVADKLNESGVKAIAYHSKIESRPLIDPATGEYYKLKTKDEIKIFGKTLIKKYAIEGLHHNFFTALVTVKSLDEGFTCDAIEQVITTGGSTNPVNYSQRVARGNTLNPYKPDKVTKVVNLYFDDFMLPDGSMAYSRDKSKLKQRQKYAKSVSWVKKLDEIFG